MGGLFRAKRGVGFWVAGTSHFFRWISPNNPPAGGLADGLSPELVRQQLLSIV